MGVSENKLIRQAVDFQNAGKLAQAERIYRKLAKQQPERAEVLFRLAALLTQQGCYEEPIGIFERLAGRYPENASIQYNLALAYKGIGRDDDACQSLAEAVRLKPDFLYAHINRITLYKMHGDWLRAQDACQYALRFIHSSAELWTLLGDIHREQCRPDDAEKAYQRAVSLDERHAPAYHGLGLLAKAGYDFQAAVEIYEQALVKVPDSVLLQNALADVWMANGEIDRALELYRAILQMHPENNAARNNFVCALQEAGRHDEARSLLERNIKGSGTDRQTILNMLNVLTEQGDFDAARRLCTQLLKQGDKTDIGYIYHTLAQIKTFTDGDAEIKSMEAGLAECDDRTEQRMLLCFALGKAYEDIGNYDRAMSYYDRGNALKRKSIHYDPEQERRVINGLKATFTADFFQQRSDFGADSQAPIFIIGMPRSGTSLVEQVLASHPEVIGAGERSDLDVVIKQYIHAIRPALFPEGLVNMSRAESVALAQAYLERIRRRYAFSNRFTDKMPGNFIYVGLIKMLFPGARIIHCVRDPVATCLSCYKRYFSGNGLYFSYNQDELGQYYCLYKELMAHWHLALPGFIYDLSYEKLVDDFEDESRSLLAYCGLDWSDNCLEFHKTKRAVSTHSLTQVRTPVYHDSVKLWRRFEPYIGSLVQSLALCRDLNNDCESP